MIPIVAKKDKGEITVRISSFNILRYDLDEIPITVLVRLFSESNVFVRPAFYLLNLRV